MILRKPYAFLIKHFRMIHAVMAVCLVYLVYETSAILNFFNGYDDKQLSYIDGEVSSTLFSIWLFVVPLIVVLASIVVMSLMYNKQKPIKFYFVNILVCIATIVFYGFANSIINTMELRLVDTRTVRLYRDLSLLVTSIQFLNMMILFVRATGFDIKKFDFGQDLAELKVESQDREEFEVEVNFDNSEAKREWRKNIRYFKYTYIENKRTIHVALFIVLLMAASMFLLDKFVYHKTVNQGNFFAADSVMMKINASYLIENDYYDVKIAEDKAYLILNVSLHSKNNRESLLEVARSAIVIDGVKYYPVTKNTSLFSSFGTLYTGQKLTHEAQEYMLVYEIPESVKNNKSSFLYETKNIGFSAKTIKVRLNPIGFDNSEVAGTYKIGDEASLSGTVIGEGKLKIETMNVDHDFYNAYDFCVSEEECYLSFERVQPNLLTNEPLSLISIEGTSKGFKTTLNKLISIYGRLTYKIGNQEYQTTQLKEVASKHPTENVYYFEVPDRMRDANYIELKLRIDDKTYLYTLKSDNETQES